MTPCKICNAKTEHLFTETLMNRYTVRYERCSECGYTCTENPYWLEQAYASPINISDTGVVARNERIRDALVFLFSMKYRRKHKFLDYAGGYGLLTRMMRDRGFDYYWLDPYSENLFSRGFEMNEAHLPYNAISCCESFEHFVDPPAELEKILRLGSTVFFTTTLIPNPPPAPGEWNYYGFSHGQHVSFYTVKALKRLAGKYNYKLSSNGSNFHCMGPDVPSSLLMKIAFSPAAKFARLLLPFLRRSYIQADWKMLKGCD